MLVHREFLPDKGQVSSVEEEFSVSVASPRWVISETREASGKQIHKETSFDGTNVYQLLVLPPQAVQADGRIPISTHGSINPGDTPAPDLLVSTAPLWLAFASSGHLQGVGSGLLRPVCFLQEKGLWHRGFKAPASWRLGQHAPYLPNFVAFYDDGLTHPLTGNPVSLYPGFTNVIYSATLTDFDKITIPAQFSLKKWVQIPSSTNAAQFEPFLMDLDEAVIQAVTPSCALDTFRPSLTGLVLISDCRLQDLYPNYTKRYVVSNGDWSVMPYTALLARHAQPAPTRTTNTDSRVGRKRNVIFWAMAAASALFAILMFRASREDASPHRASAVSYTNPE